MKTKLKLIIIFFVVLISITSILYFSNHSFTLDDEKFCEINDEGFDIVIKCVYFDSNDVWQNNEQYKPRLEQLQLVLDYCNDTSEEKNLIGLEYFNDTHYINNNLCKWQKLTQFPNSDEFCIPGQNMWANVKEIRNDTHIYDKDKCLWEEEFSWEEEWKGKFQPPEDEHKEIVENTSDESNIQCQGSKLCITKKIVKIIDGDTIHLEGDHKIRLSLTNTPERHELGFYEASQFTAEMCPVGTTATVDQDDNQPYDVYGRLLGKVTCGNNVLNSELLYAGHANILEKYCSTSEFSDEGWALEFGC